MRAITGRYDVKIIGKRLSYNTVYDMVDLIEFEKVRQWLRPVRVAVAMAMTAMI